MNRSEALSNEELWSTPVVARGWTGAVDQSHRLLRSSRPLAGEDLFDSDRVEVARPAVRGKPSLS
jgi:hypothetical protein